MFLWPLDSIFINFGLLHLASASVVVGASVVVEPHMPNVDQTVSPIWGMMSWYVASMWSGVLCLHNVALKT